jgi:hypothetical protein
MRPAAEIAASYLAKQLSLFEAASQLHPHVDPRSTLWQALEGPHGPLPVIYVARDEAERLGFFVSNEVHAKLGTRSWQKRNFALRQEPGHQFLTAQFAVSLHLGWYTNDGLLLHTMLGGGALFHRLCGKQRSPG